MQELTNLTVADIAVNGLNGDVEKVFRRFLVVEPAFGNDIAVTAVNAELTVLKISQNCSCVRDVY